MIGLIILGLIIVPLFVLMIASVIATPGSFRVAVMFTTVFLLQIVAMMMGFAVFAYVLGFIVP